MTDNSIYDQLADTWWEADGVLAMLRTAANPWRVPYFKQALVTHFPDGPAALRLLDVGCGGGLLAEEFDRIGCQVTGIDLSHSSLQAAKTHASSSGAQIRYLAGSAALLPFPDEHFDVVACADVLEHIPNWPEAIAEISRVLRPGGLFLFDTINRTIQSWLMLIFGLQQFPLTRIFPPNTHLWKMFITPEELKTQLTHTGLIQIEITGSRLGTNPLKAVRALVRLKLGQISYQQFGAGSPLKLAANTGANYIGFAVKQALSSPGVKTSD